MAAAAASLPVLHDVTVATLAPLLAMVSGPALSDAALQTAALAMLLDLCPTAKKERCVAAEAAVDWVCATITEHLSRGGVVEKGLSLLARISWATADERPLVRPAVPMLLAVLDAPPSVTSVSSALSVLSNLAFHKDNKAVLMPHAAVAAAAMARHDDATVQEKGCLFLSRLTVRTENLPALVQHAPLVVAVMKKHMR